MRDYKPPIEDMMFVLEHVLDTSRLEQIKSGEIETEDARAILDEAGKLAAEVVAPTNHTGDKAGCTFNNGEVKTPDGISDAYKEYIEGGWNSVPFDPEYGGMGLPWTLSFPLHEMWQSANLSFSLCALLNQAAVEALSAHGTKELKDIYLEKLISGKWAGTMHLTEPHAGSDMATLKTTAEKREDGTFRLKGQKIFITYGEHDLTENIIHMVLARTPEAGEGIKGLSLFLVPKFLLDSRGDPDGRNDVRCVALEHKLGIHASPTCVMQFGDRDGAIGYLVGEEGEGMKNMFTMMNSARLCVALQGVALAERAYQHARDYASERVQGGCPIIEHEDVKRMLLVMKSQTEAGRILAYEAGYYMDMADAGDQLAANRVELLTPIVKSWCTYMAEEVASTGIQIHGGMGFIEETGAAQYYRDARITSIYEGTNGIQSIDLVFRKTVKNSGQFVREWLEDSKKDIEALSNSNEFKIIYTDLSQALSSLEEALEEILQAASKDKSSVGAIAVPYNNAFGYIAAGVVMARSVIASKQLIEETGKSDFHMAKINKAMFYITHILPRYEACLRTVRAGSNSVTSFSHEMFAV
jgi:alkylation response protein AidB-like acyl-CoA dehydrogenase